MVLVLEGTSAASPRHGASQSAPLERVRALADSLETGLRFFTAVRELSAAQIAKLRGRVADLESYMTDVLGARLTLSEDMKRAQAWAMAERGRIGKRTMDRARSLRGEWRVSPDKGSSL